MMFRVEFAIDVDAGSPEEACADAWARLTGDNSSKPVGAVTKHGDYAMPVLVDLQALLEREEA